MKMLLAVLLACDICGSVAAQAPTPPINDETIDRITRQEKKLVGGFAAFTPIAETYIQEFRPRDGAMVPYTDHYFLSQAKLGPRVDGLPFKGTRKGNSVVHFAKSSLSIKLEYLAEGFAQMAHPNVEDFDRDHYSFEYAGGESLGDTDCLVIEVSPLDQYKKHRGMFEGQIWVENKSYTIVRYKGVFIGGNDRVGYYFHFDSIRVKAKNGLWLPSSVYAEESNYAYNKIAFFALDHARFRARTNFWGYGPVLVGSEIVSPLETDKFSGSQHQRISNSLLISMPDDSSENRGEHALLVRLQQFGLLAASNELDRKLDAIAEKIEIANHVHFQPEALCRELLTSRLELFTVGHTIVISRGLIDVANDDATLAAVVALGLARLELTTPDYHSAYQRNFDPQNALVMMSFASPLKSRKKIQELAADYLALSPYSSSMPLIYEFFNELAKSARHIPELVVANLGDNLLRDTVFSWAGAQSEKGGKTQQRALPLGTRTKIDPWTNRIELIETPTKDKFANNNAAFEVTPYFPPPNEQ